MATRRLKHSGVGEARVLFRVSDPKNRYTAMVRAVDALYRAKPRQYTALDKSGKLQEKIFNVAWSSPDKRKLGSRRQVAASGQHGRLADGHLEQHDRGSGADHGLERP